MHLAQWSQESHNYEVYLQIHPVPGCSPKVQIWTEAGIGRHSPPVLAAQPNSCQHHQQLDFQLLTAARCRCRMQFHVNGAVLHCWCASASPQSHRSPVQQVSASDCQLLFPFVYEVSLQLNWRSSSPGLRLLGAIRSRLALKGRSAPRLVDLPLKCCRVWLRPSRLMSNTASSLLIDDPRTPARSCCAL